jgi:hypothetical protein
MRRAPNKQIGNTRRPLRRVLRDRNPLTATPKTLILRREVASLVQLDGRHALQVAHLAARPAKDP